MREVTLDAWHAEGRALFGEHPWKWRWRCPSCGQEQTRPDWLSYGVLAREVDRHVAFNCIGLRVLEVCPTADVVDFAEPTRGFGCRYLGAGLFPLNPVRLLLPSGETRDVFDWTRKL